MTYCLQPLDRLPAIPSTLNGSFDWLAQVPEPLEWAITTENESSADADFRSRALVESVQLPSSFLALLASPRLRWGVRSGTGCWWSLDADSLQQLPVSDQVVVRFLTDQQGVLFWYLLLNGTREPPVIVSHQDFSDPGTWEALPLDQVYRCAPSFEAFMYRCWIENEIRFRTSDGEGLTSKQLRYLKEAQRLHAGGPYLGLSD